MSDRQPWPVRPCGGLRDGSTRGVWPMDFGGEQLDTENSVSVPGPWGDCGWYGVGGGNLAGHQKGERWLAKNSACGAGENGV